MRPALRSGHALPPAAHPPGGYTVADYLSWDDGKRWEVIEGELFDMSPAPTVLHQIISSMIERSLYRALDACVRKRIAGARKWQVLHAPVDVVFSDSTVVQPDIVVVHDPVQFANKRNIAGVPALVVEILSPSTALKDKRQKLALYEKHGVPEFVVVGPIENYCEVFTLGAEGRYGLPRVVGPGDTLTLAAFPRHKFDVAQWFTA
jgi:Uma2 family endonuclease